MPPIYDDLSKVEVSGLSVYGCVRGFQNFTLIATKFLLAEGIGTRGSDGLVQVDPNRWYPLRGYLNALNNIAREVGLALTQKLGANVMLEVEWPPQANSLAGAAKFIDFGYHLHHRKDGQVLANPQDFSVREGIGHYRGIQVAPDVFHFHCENPYPCHFDRGIIAGAVKRLNLKASVMHDDTRPCRLKGGDHCTMIVRTLRG